ncbi:MAG: PIN domain-containing protein [Acidimicrobiales bacterium]
MSAFVDTNILVRHLTGDPPDMGQRATTCLATERGLLLADLVVAETVHVLESFYEAPRRQVAETMRSLLAHDPIVCVDPALLYRAVELYEVDHLDFGEAYLVACAESTEIRCVASFDQALDRIDAVQRVEPPRP